MMRGQDRVDAEASIDDVGDVGAEDDEGRMRDVDDVEDAERDRHADRHGGVEAAEQQPGDDGIDQQVPGKSIPLPTGDWFHADCVIGWRNRAVEMAGLASPL